MDLRKSISADPAEQRTQRENASRILSEWERRNTRFSGSYRIDDHAELEREIDR